MSGAIQVVRSDIRAAAKKFKEAADGVQKADPSTDVDDIATSMRGSASASAATTLSSTWKTRFSDWSKDGNNQHDKLNTAASNYDEADHRAATSMRAQCQQIPR